MGCHHSTTAAEASKVALEHNSYNKTTHIEDTGITILSNTGNEILERRSSKHFLANIVPEQVNKDIRLVYEIENTQVLGFGASGVVKECIHRASGRTYALKTIHKHSLRPDAIERLRTEIAIMQEVDHPNILRLYEVFEDEEKIYLISELCLGGDLCSKLSESEGGWMDETKASSYVYSIISAVKYLHSNNIIHRDLKLDNFLLEDEEEKAALKLTDFGVSRHLCENETTVTGKVGTPYYVAPEVITGQTYTCKCDIWSIGVCAYFLLFGEPPFPGGSVNETKPLIVANKPKYLQWLESQEESTTVDGESITMPNRVSREGLVFIRRCLTSDPDKRPTAIEALDDPWFSSVIRLDGGKGLSIVRIHDFGADPHALDPLQEFKRKTALSRFCAEVLVYSLPSSEFKSLRKEFLKYDLDNDGVISKDDFKAVVEKLQANLDVDEMFATINFTNSGVINYHEFLAAMLDLSQISSEKFKAAFDLISLGKDYFDIDDVVRVLGVDSSFEEVANMLREAKFANNSRITFATYAKLLRDMGSQASLTSLSSIELNFGENSSTS